MKFDLCLPDSVSGYQPPSSDRSAAPAPRRPCSAGEGRVFPRGQAGSPHPPGGLAPQGCGYKATCTPCYSIEAGKEQRGAGRPPWTDRRTGGGWGGGGRAPCSMIASSQLPVSVSTCLPDSKPLVVPTPLRTEGQGGRTWPQASKTFQGPLLRAASTPGKPGVTPENVAPAPRSFQHCQDPGVDSQFPARPQVPSAGKGPAFWVLSIIALQSPYLVWLQDEES